MPCPSHYPWFDLPNDIWWWVQIMKLPIVQLSPLSRYFIPLRSVHNSKISKTMAGSRIIDSWCDADCGGFIQDVPDCLLKHVNFMSVPTNTNLHASWWTCPWSQIWNISWKESGMKDVRLWYSYRVSHVTIFCLVLRLGQTVFVFVYASIKLM
jgi:hypothetical protein